MATIWHSQSLPSLPLTGMAVYLENGVVSSARKAAMALIGAALSLFAQADDPEFPSWLAGRPDLDIKADRCMLYDWFLSEADGQTDGNASKEDPAKMRVINIANKLVDHHETARLEEYTGTVKYLVFGERGPLHFSFQISNGLLEQLLNESSRE